jgi:hypothetical protein
VTKALGALLLGERMVGSSSSGGVVEVFEPPQEPRIMAEAAAPERLFKKSLLERPWNLLLLSFFTVSTSPDRIIYVDAQKVSKIDANLSNSPTAYPKIS